MPLAREDSMGRRPQIDRAAVIDAAMQLADASGLEAVTMHAVAQRLDVTPMALYRHVDGKQALLDGMVERLLTGYPLPLADAPWPDRLTGMAEAMRSTAKQHPAVFPLLLTRPAATPGARTVRDYVQAALREAGLSADDAARAERLTSTAVLGFAASEAAGRFRHHAQAVVDEDFAVLLRWLRLALSPGAAPHVVLDEP
jgi:AcrR family transcriptional regulator